MGFFEGAAGGILGGAVSAISNLFTANAQKKENARQRQFAHDEAVLAHERQVELQNSQNQWNSFENQAQLAKNAGLNPKRIFDTGASGIARSSGSTSGSQASAPSVGSMPQLMDPQAIAGLVTAFSQAKKDDSQSKLLEMQAQVEEQKIYTQQLENQALELKNQLDQQFAAKEREYAIWKISTEASLNISRQVLTNIDYQLKAWQRDIANPQLYSNMVTEQQKLASEKLLNDILREKNETERQKMIGEYFLSCKLTFAQSAKLYAEAESIKQDTINKSPGGVLWNTWNKDYWRKHIELNTAIPYNSNLQLYYKTYNHILRDFKKDFLETPIMYKLWNERDFQLYKNNYLRWMDESPWMMWIHPNPGGATKSPFSDGAAGLFTPHIF